MGLLSGNSCNIITLLPLGLDCDSVDATTPDDANGIVALFITGGTPPYNVSWNNGSQGTLITNLVPGNYTATVVDYYGDFTATTTCVVGFDSFYLEEFENCKDNSKIYYLSDLPSIFVTGKTYQLTTQTGCWTSSGTTLYTGQTYYDQFAQVQSGPFDNCVDCLPTPEPLPVYPSKLCLTYGNGKVFTSVEINSGSTINGYPSWTASSPSNSVIYYNTGNTRWEISGWTQNGVPVFVSPTIPPVGTWSILGTYGNTLIITEGGCQVTRLILNLQKTDPSCTTSNDGSIFATTTGGVSPYTYSLDGINYFSTNILTSLSPGTYTIYTKDNNNTTTSQSITLVPQNTFQNYIMNITTISQTNSSGLNSSSKQYDFKIEVVPQLPNNTTLNFSLPINVLFTGNTTTQNNITTTQNYTVSFQTFGTSTITGPTTSPVITTNNPRPTPCIRVDINTSAFTETYQGSITGSGYIIGTINQQVITPNVNANQNGCGLKSAIKNVITLSNQQLIPSNCSYLQTAVQPLEYTIDKTGSFIIT